MHNLSRVALEAIVRFIPAGVVVIEKENGRVSYVNDRAIQLYGVDPREFELPNDSTKLMKLLTMNGDVYPPEQLPARKALLMGKEIKDNLMIQRRDGSLIVVSASAVPLKNEVGEVFAAVGVFYDITEQLKAEEALRQK